jgi:hypothetical protein
MQGCEMEIGEEKSCDQKSLSHLVSQPEHKRDYSRCAAFGRYCLSVLTSLADELESFPVLASYPLSNPSFDTIDTPNDIDPTS